ncbi:putative uncharacterized protein ENSP00000383407 [Carlito syrichta]|uniref:Uncharacterized protein n=1 Tax=Carlito syrichta TaxID=1868482 RepID=A0A3Q0EAP8_CARSF|nr:putative uncharacterized protein ENSP00000383407 [Carlito syrichta]
MRTGQTAVKAKESYKGKSYSLKHRDKGLKLTKMNLFCISLEGSMESLYEPVPDQQTNPESASNRIHSPIPPIRESEQGHNNLFMEFSNLENAKPQKRKLFRRFMSENKIFEEKTVNDKPWQEPSKPENDSHIRRPCQLKGLNEDDFLLTNNIHTLQRKNLQGTSYQVTSECWSPFHYQGHVKPTADEMAQEFMWSNNRRHI